jgi:SAM-dependent methyltransferase
MTEPGAPTSRDDWEEHWAAFGDAARDNPAVAYRSRLIGRHLGHLRAGERVLDLGCGEGDLVADLHRRYPDVELLGMDISHEGIARARALVPAARFIERNLLRVETGDEEFAGWATVAVCSEVLEHLDDPGQFLTNARRFLAPGCRLVVTVPAGPMSAFDRYIGHRRHYTAAGLEELLARAGFGEISVRRAGFPFFNLYRLLVIARSGRLTADAETHGLAELSRAARLVLRGFDLALSATLDASPFGWQLIADVRVAAA